MLLHESCCWATCRLAEGNSFSFLLVGSVGDGSALFAVAVSHGLGTNPAAVLLFRKRSPSAFWLGFAWWLAGLQVFRCTKVNVAEGNSFSFLLVGSVGNVSAVFVVAVSHGLGTNPAAVLLFRKRSPSTFWLGFAWWLAGFQVFRCTKVNLAEGNPGSFLLVGSVGDVSWLRFRMAWARILLLRESCCSRCIQPTQNASSAQNLLIFLYLESPKCSHFPASPPHAQTRTSSNWSVSFWCQFPAVAFIPSACK